jgi:beta-lactamase class C
VVFHGGAVQGYRGAMALLPGSDLGIAILWNSESGLPSGLLPTIIDSALGLSGGQWLDEDVAGPEPTMYANEPGTPAGVEASASSASPE